jgi:hypothetical protein
MSRKIAVLDVHQRQTDKPVTYVKRTVAESLVMRLMAKWVVYGIVAQRLPEVCGLQRLQNHPLITHEAPEDSECLSLAGVHSCTFELRGRRTRDTAAGWMAAKWLKEEGAIECHV